MQTPICLNPSRRCFCLHQFCGKPSGMLLARSQQRMMSRLPVSQNGVDYPREWRGEHNRDVCTIYLIFKRNFHKQ